MRLVRFQFQSHDNLTLRQICISLYSFLGVSPFFVQISAYCCVVEYMGLFKKWDSSFSRIFIPIFFIDPWLIFKFHFDHCRTKKKQQI